ncbi:MAG: glycoside hydrolase family 97 catalytic domain-containing protein [Bacteroidota bacterium]|jgi:hypothetical protein
MADYVYLFKSMKKSLTSLNLFVIATLLFFVSKSVGMNKENCVESPNGSISVFLTINDEGVPEYSVSFRGEPVMKGNRLGLLREDADFSKELRLVSTEPIEKIEDHYTLLYGKKTQCSYIGNRRVFHFKNAVGEEIDVIFQVSNDGVAFRYFFPGKPDGIKRITDELTSFSFNDSTRAWIQHIAQAKSGWNATNPSFEEYYLQCGIKEIPNREPGWMLPVLLQSGKYWISLTETAPDHNYCGCRLMHDTLSTSLKIRFPQKPEVFYGGALNPEATLPWSSPWRIITISDNLGTLVESTLGTDLAKPSVLSDLSYIKPGRSSWSWVLLKDDSTIYPVQKRFIDYASEMGWEYCLIDADWDRKIGYEKLGELCAYAKSRNVGITVWYNSAGNWNTTPLTPRDKMIRKELRDSEFTKLKELGVKGIKVDFFGGEGQSMMSYYQDILEDAARYSLTVDFHGSTYPRGLQRTFPNLISMEGIRGFEYVTFEQANADREAQHCTVIPFTRNLFDPMDFTPVCFSEVPHIQRKTTNSFELALSVLFLSGIQHYAEIPEGIAKVPGEVKEVLKNIPVSWDETKFIDGVPGKYIIIARRKDNIWYIAGINGEPIEKNLEVNIRFIGSVARCLMITCGDSNRSFKVENKDIDTILPVKIVLKPNDGFLFRLFTK